MKIKKNAVATALVLVGGVLFSGCFNGCGTPMVKTDKDASAKFVKNILEVQKHASNVEVEVIHSVPLSGGWRGEVVNFSLKAPDGREIKNQRGNVFTNGELFASELLDANGTSLEYKLEILLPDSVYSEEHILFKGSAGERVVIFSDLQCPFCIQNVPTIIDEAVGKNQSVYYYDFPLSMHPNSKNISIVMHTAFVLQPEKKLDVLKLFYSSSFNQNIEPLGETIKTYNEVIKGSSFKPMSEADVEKAKSINFINASIEVGVKNGVGGTPSVFENGLRKRN